MSMVIRTLLIPANALGSAAQPLSRTGNKAGVVIKGWDRGRDKGRGASCAQHAARINGSTQRCLGPLMGYTPAVRVK